MVNLRLSPTNKVYCRHFEAEHSAIEDSGHLQKRFDLQRFDLNVLGEFLLGYSLGTINDCRYT